MTIYHVRGRSALRSTTELTLRPKPRQSIEIVSIIFCGFCLLKSLVMTNTLIPLGNIRIRVFFSE